MSKTDFIKITLCSEGDPTHPSTWSGTCYHLYQEFLKMGRVEDSFCYAGSANRWKLKSLLSVLYYMHKPHTSVGYIHRYVNSYHVKKRTRRNSSGPSHTLHFTSSGLPFCRYPEGQFHYLYTDCTWHTWRHSVLFENCTNRLLRDMEKLERKMYQQLSHIFSTSEYAKNDMINRYGVPPEKITVVGTGLGVIKPYSGAKDYANGKILFSAKERFSDKGGDLILEAFGIALKKNPDLQLTIVGQNDYTGKISLPRVTTKGFIPIEELQGLFNESSLFLMPALNEPWGLVYLEALACRIPIVGLNRNAFPELSGYGKYGFVLNDSNPEKLAEIILYAFSNPEETALMGMEGQAFCLNNFSWEKAATTIIDTIQRIHE